MKAPASGASLATAAPAAEETPKAAVPSEAQSSGLDMDRDLSLRSFFLVVYDAHSDQSILFDLI